MKGLLEERRVSISSSHQQNSCYDLFDFNLKKKLQFSNYVFSYLLRAVFQT